MPIAKFKCVREVSSEDKAFTADNLLKQDYGKKWRAKAGEKTACVILELECSNKITGIDIGNEHSAFIEVQVGRSSAADFTEILLCCSFMTPSESKSSTNPNRVRCFGSDGLVQTALAEKWSLVKVICSQPFNTHVPYGLSFIKIHTAESTDRDCEKPSSFVPSKCPHSTEAASSKNITSKFKIKLREESPESESENTNSLFNRWKVSRHSDGAPTAATTIKTQTVSQTSVLDRNRESLLFGDSNDEETPSSSKLKRLEKHIEQDRERQRAEAKEIKHKTERKSVDKAHHNTSAKPCTKTPIASEAERKSVDKAHHNTSVKQTTKNPVATEAERKRRSVSSPSNAVGTPPKKAKLEQMTQSAQPKKSYRPLQQLLQGVVLVISGIQNPDRADLRNKALALGAKYKGDWSPGCTHLICAFKNTPKYNQVKGKGKIVQKSWIEQCYKLKKYLPWRRYALDSTEQTKAESDEEIWDVSLQPSENTDNQNDIEPPRTMVNDTLALYDQANDNRAVSSGSDTDDDIQRVQGIMKNATKIKGEDDFHADTEEEEYLQAKLRAIA